MIKYGTILPQKPLSRLVFARRAAYSAGTKGEPLETNLKGGCKGLALCRHARSMPARRGQPLQAAFERGSLT